MKFLIPAAIICTTALLITGFVARYGGPGQQSSTTVQGKVAQPQWEGQHDGGSAAQYPAEPALPSVKTPAGQQRADITSGSSSATADPTPDLEQEIPQHAIGEASPEAVKVLEGFCQDFVTPGDDWHRRVSSWTTDALATRLETTDPRNVPTISCDSIQIVSSGPGIAVGRMAYGAPGRELDVRCEELIEGWRVTVYTPVATAGTVDQE